MLAGQQELIEEWYERYGHDLYRSLRAAVKNPEEAQDISQETFLKVAVKLSSDECEDAVLNPKAFLYRVAFNEFYTRHKRKKLQSHLIQLFGDDDDDRISVITPEQVAMGNEELAVVNSAIEELPDKQRQVFLLTRQKHMSHKDIAEQLGIKKDTVKKHIGRVLTVLRGVRQNYLEGKPAAGLVQEDE